MLPRTTAVINGKGGVGKTSVATNLAALVAAAGYRVLLVDMDAQGNVSDDLGIKGTASDDQGASMVAALITGAPLRPVLNVRASLDLVCGGDQLAQLVGTVVGRQMQGEDVSAVLQDALATVAGNYDLVLIDCPPGERVIQRLIMTAAQFLLIPTKSDRSSLDGLAAVAKMFGSVTASTNPDLELLGVVLFGIGSSAKRIKEDTRAQIERDLGTADLVFRTTIRHVESAAVGGRSAGLVIHELEEQLPEQRRAYFEALRDRGRGLHRTDRPAPRVAASSAGLAGDYAALAEEVLDRIAIRLEIPA